jgi:hypothetical protein
LGRRAADLEVDDAASRGARGFWLSVVAHVGCFVMVAFHPWRAPAASSVAVDPVGTTLASFEVSTEREPPAPAPPTKADEDRAPAVAAAAPAVARLRERALPDSSRVPGEPRETRDASDGRELDPRLYVRDIGDLLPSLKRRLAHPLAGGFAHMPDREPPDASLQPPYPIVSDERISKDDIREIVRANARSVRACQPSARSGDPALAGVAVTFVIGSSGKVLSAEEIGGDLPEDVRACIAQTFLGLTFPPPDRGRSTVTYPLVLPNRQQPAR